ncbi:MAG: enoyl-CoA hydratase-related protein, partial [Acidobacteria bacterium]|nr:enoyl-CoA hydratase-related protein [Acidobacteriota bacterium]
VCADHVVAEDAARFGTPEARLGLVPAVISPYVVRRLGPGRAGPFLLGGGVAKGIGALAAGIAHELSPVGGLDDVLGQTLARFLQNAPRAVRQAKSLLLRESPLPPPEIEELTIGAIAEARASEEGQAGTAAFFRKISPPWAPRGSR